MVSRAPAGTKQIVNVSSPDFTIQIAASFFRVKQVLTRANALGDNKKVATSATRNKF